MGNGIGSEKPKEDRQPDPNLAEALSVILDNTETHDKIFETCKVCSKPLCETSREEVKLLEEADKTFFSDKVTDSLGRSFQIFTSHISVEIFLTHPEKACKQSEGFEMFLSCFLERNQKLCDWKLTGDGPTINENYLWFCLQR